MSVMSKSSPVPIKFDSASKRELQREINEFMKPTDKEVRINFDDELSQVVPNTTNYQEQITKHITFLEVDLPKPAADIFSQTKNSQSISPSA